MEKKDSKLIVGTMRWGTWGENYKPSALAQLLENLVQNNLYEYDLADIYGHYTSEKLFGDGLKQSNIERSKLFLISKCNIQLPCENRPYKVVSYNTSKNYILQSVQQSLKNLQTDYLDLLLIHRTDPLMNHYEIAETFDLLSKKGIVKHFGVSNFDVFDFEFLHSLFPLYTNQIQHSLTYTDSLFNHQLQLGLKHQIPIQIWSPLGTYFDKKFENIPLVNVVQKLAEKYSCSESQVLCAWALKHSSTIDLVVGSSKLERILEAQKSLSLTLEIEDWYELLRTSRGFDVP